MITLVTGSPGSGKSAYTLSLMLSLLAHKRPLFVHGVTGLTIPHRLVRCGDSACMACGALDVDTYKRIRSAEDWEKWAPKGAVLWWDEVQHIHRPRTSGSKVPANVAAYETHRHRGLDFFLTTQHPGLIDSNVRNLVGRHVHLVSSWKGRTMWEWPECSSSLSNKSDAMRNSYALPKHVFPLYQSSQLHTKPLRKVPQAVYWFAVCIVAIAVLVGRLVIRLDEAISPPDPSEQTASIPMATGNPTGKSEVKPVVVPVNLSPLAVAGLSKFDYQPNEKTPNIPESAPAFIDLVKPSTFPKLAGCAVNPKKPDDCRCYTQQATRYNVSVDMCRAYIKYGKFDPYRGDGVGVSAANTGPGEPGRGEPIPMLKSPS